MALTLCVLLTAVPGNEARLVEYEDQVLRAARAPRRALLQRVRTVDGRTTTPYEVHVIEFPSEAALAAVPRRSRRGLALADLRDAGDRRAPQLAAASRS